jgi:hypothetical protein
MSKPEILAALVALILYAGRRWRIAAIVLRARLRLRARL